MPSPDTTRQTTVQVAATQPPAEHSLEAIPSNGLRIETEVLPDSILVAHIRGDVDARSGTEFRDRMEETAVAGRLVVDMEEVTFLGVAGLSALVDLANHASLHGLVWAVAASGRAVVRPLITVGILDLIPVRPTVQAAIESVSAATG